MLIAPEPYQLRPLQLEDLEAVYVIERLSLPTPSKKGVYQHELTQNQLAHYQALTGNGRNLIGYSGFWQIADEAHISIIAVHPDWRGQGLGELLLLNLLFVACEQQLASVMLEVRRSNTIAQALYLKYAFEIVGERRRYYSNGEDALLMTAVLACDTLPEKQKHLFSRWQK